MVGLGTQSLMTHTHTHTHPPSRNFKENIEYCVTRKQQEDKNVYTTTVTRVCVCVCVSGVCVCVRFRELASEHPSTDHYGNSFRTSSDPKSFKQSDSTLDQT